MFKKYLEIDNFPLYYGTLGDEVLRKLPRKMKLNLGYDTDLHIIKLDVNEELNRVLDRTYAAGSNPSVALGKGKIQSRILDSLVEIIKDFSKNKDNFSIIEIGCGEGRLLNTLSDNDWSLKGFEIRPSKELTEKLSKKGIEIINDFYTHDKINEKVDMIFSYGVVEHIVELESFFTESYKGLKQGGVFCHVVPDCEEMFNQANMRILSHQHVNYFTKNSFIDLYKKFGFIDVGYKIITPGNGLMVYGYKDESRSEVLEENIETKNIVKNFAKGFKSSLNKLSSFLDNNKTEKICFYGGGMPEYIILKREEEIIFVNSDEELFAKKFFIELSAIENPELLKNSDVNIIVVFASHYLAEIKNYISDELMLPKNIKIISIDEIIE